MQQPQQQQNWPHTTRRQQQRRGGPRVGRDGGNGSGMLSGGELVDRLAAYFQPQFDDIKRQLDGLVTRREHEKDLAELKADQANMQRQIDRMLEWQDKRPRETVEAARVERLEQDVHLLEKRPAQAEQSANRWLTFAIAAAALLISGLCGALGLLLQLAPLVLH